MSIALISALVFGGLDAAVGAAAVGAAAVGAAAVGAALGLDAAVGAGAAVGGLDAGDDVFGFDCIFLAPVVDRD